MALRSVGNLDGRQLTRRIFQNRTSLTLCDSLDEGCEDEAQIITWIEPMPECTGDKSCQTGSESWFLPPGRNAKVNVVPQPFVGIHVPVFQKGPGVLSGLDAPSIDILEPIPVNTPSLRIDAFVAESGKDACALGQGPYSVELEPCGEAEHL